MVSVITVHATPNATTVAITAPDTTPMTLLPNTAITLRHQGVPRWSGGGSSSSAALVGRRGPRLTRAKAGVALAGLRHPAAINATMASPAIQAEAVVSSVIDTQHDIVTTRPPAVRPPARIHRAWAVPLTAVAFVVLLAMLLASMLSAELTAENARGEPAPYGVVPANATEVAPRIAFDAVERYEAGGEILFVTIRQPELTLLDWFISRAEPSVSPLSETDKYGVQTPDQKREVNLVMMRTAKENAEYVALSYLGYPAEIVLGEVIVGSLLCFEATEDGRGCAKSSPADDVLDPGDRLLEVDGRPITLIDDLTPVLAERQPGERIEVVFDRPGEGEQTGEIELILAPNEDLPRTIIGFVPFDTATAELPFDVSIESNDIGGPSAGLAFTLTLIDELTPGELTGGRQVAVTGTINVDGTVGAIGGLASKTSAVLQMGAEIFLVPASQSDEDIARAKKIAGNDLEVIPVATLEEALAALAERGGNGLELGQPGADFESA